MTRSKPKAPSSTTRKKTKKRKQNSPGEDEDVLEFIRAVDEYKRSNNKPFPSWSEILEIIRDLGYRKAR